MDGRKTRCVQKVSKLKLDLQMDIEWNDNFLQTQNRNPQNIDDLWGFSDRTMGKYHYHFF